MNSTMEDFPQIPKHEFVERMQGLKNKAVSGETTQLLRDIVVQGALV